MYYFLLFVNFCNNILKNAKVFENFAVIHDVRKFMIV